MREILAIGAIIGVILMVLAQITGIGEAIYLWGGCDQPFGASVWEGFKTWMVMMSSGIALFIVGAVANK